MNDFTEKQLSKNLESLINIPIIHELQEIHINNYYISTKEDILYPLIEQNQVIVVGGAFFGDEGKGKKIAAVAPHPDIELIMRVNSGQNAGHTIFFEGQKYVFHLVPSGIFTGKKNLVGDNCVMDPISFVEEELMSLVARKHNYSNLFVGNVHIVAPYHKIIDALGTTNSSTLKGISPSHASKVTKKGLRLDDLFGSKDDQKKIIESDMKIYSALVNKDKELELVDLFNGWNKKKSNTIPIHVMEFLQAKDKASYLIDIYSEKVVANTAFPERADTNKIMRDVLKNGGKVLLEGPQSYFLSNAVAKHWRSSTSADTTSAGIKAAAGYNQEAYKSVTINVHKNPGSSRVGIGANPSGFVPQDYFSGREISCLDDLAGVCNDFDVIQKQFYDSVQENGILRPTMYIDKNGQKIPIHVAMAIASAKHYDERGATTLKPRVTGLFDAVAHAYVNDAQGPHLTISAVDRGDTSDKVGIVVAYAVSNQDNKTLISNGKNYTHGDIIRPGDAMPNETVLYHCVPIIKVIDGWKKTPIAHNLRNEADPLPESVNRFISEIEHYTGANIISIGNGPKTEQLLYIKK